MKKLLFILTISLTSCDMLSNKQPEQPKLTNDMATVNTVAGIPVFIKSKPSKKYKTIGNQINLNAIDGITDAGEGKKGLDAVISVVSEVGEDIDFNKKVDKMVNKAIKENSGAEGVLFETTLTQCYAIKFTE